jgi:hypothetical protein
MNQNPSGFFKDEVNQNTKISTEIIIITETNKPGCQKETNFA